MLSIVVYFGRSAVLGLIFIVNCICIWEFSSLNRKQPFKPFILMGLGSLFLITAYYNEKDLIAILPIVFMLIFAYNIINKNSDVEDSLFDIWALLYISFFLSLSIPILYYPKGIYYIVLGLISCYSCDTFAYFVGVAFGKHKLIPEISPKKSIEGSIGGIIGAIIMSGVAGIIYTNYFGFNLPFFHYLLLGFFISIFAQFGDLTASMVKRKFHVKDYSDLIPGHGGMLDRIDSLLFTFGILYFYMSIFMNAF